MLPDLLAPNLKLVICGSAAGERSARLGAYYAGRGNTFWQTLATIGLTSRQLAPSEFRMLLDFGIGLTDLVKDQAGNDVAIRFGASYRSLMDQTILQWQPAVLCFNGKRSAKEYFGTDRVHYGLQPSLAGATRLFVAPSTSGAARRSWDLAVWQELAVLVQASVA